MGSFSLGHWLIVGFIVWGVYRIFKRRGPEVRATAATSRGNTGTVNLVGESFYRQNFERLFPRNASGNDTEVDATVTLKLDDGNPHDNQAVAAFIKGLQVGHLARDDARRYRRAKGADRRDALVDATVWVPGDPEYHYSVTLKLKL